MDQESILAELRSERARMDHAISALEGLAGPSGPRVRPPKSQAAPARGETRRRTMTSGSPQANLKRYEAALGKVEGQICSQEIGSCEDEEPSNDERCRQEEAVGIDESPLGCEEKTKT